MHIRDWPRDERPREKLLKQGAVALSDAELLALFVAWLIFYKKSDILQLIIIRLRHVRYRIGYIAFKLLAWHLYHDK